MLMLTAEDVRQALPMVDAIDAMRDAFRQLAEGTVEMPLRTAVHVPATGGVTLVMSARCEGPFGVGTKVVSVFPGHPIHAVVMLLDATSGEPVAVLDGASLTAIRTGAVGGLATDLLARRDAARVAMIGSGVQARSLIEAVCAVRGITSATVYSPTAEHAERFARAMAGVGAVPSEIEVAPSARAAVRDADVVCTATSSSVPVLEAEWVAEGTHINAVGSFTRDMRELDPALLGNARVVVDQREAALAEAGEVIAAVRQGIVDESTLVEVGAIVTGRILGRTVSSEITVFKSVGLAVQDVVAGGRAVATWRDG